MSNPVDTRGRAMGSRGTEGEDIQHRTRRRLMCFPAIYKPIKKGHSLRAGLKTNRGIGGQKFIWHCHNTTAWQHNLTTSAAIQVWQPFYTCVHDMKGKMFIWFAVGVCTYNINSLSLRNVRYSLTLMFPVVFKAALCYQKKYKSFTLCVLGPRLQVLTPVHFYMHLRVSHSSVGHMSSLIALSLSHSYLQPICLGGFFLVLIGSAAVSPVARLYAKIS